MARGNKAITAARGAKTEMVLQAFERMPGNFTMQELARACPGVSQPTLKRVLKSLESVWVNEAGNPFPFPLLP